MRTIHLIAATLVVAATVPLPAAAAQSGSTDATAGPRLHLGEAVERTLLLQPDVQKAAQDVAKRRGQLQESRGLFDQLLTGNSTLSLKREELVGDKLQQEKDRRLKLELTADAVYAAANQELADLGAGTGDVVNSCPDLITTSYLVAPDIGFGETILCLDRDGKVIGIINPISSQGEAIGRQIAAQLFEKAAELYERRRFIGTLPTTGKDWRFDLGLRHQRKYRTGTRLSLEFSLAGTEVDFSGKPVELDCGPFLHYDPDFRELNSSDCGDSQVGNLFQSNAGVTVEVPLGKGRGRASTQASELAAEANLSAASLTLAHTAAERALDTVNAYWDLAAAQAKVQLLETSVATQGRIEGATRELAKAGEAAESEIEKAAARASQVASSAGAARLRLIEARVTLSRAMGIAGSSLEEAPLAADPLETALSVHAGGAPEGWVREGIGERSDLKAAAETARAAELLARGAKVDLAARVDLRLNASYNGFFEDFETRVFDPSGYWEALGNKVAGPSWSVSLKWALPFGNNEARGRLVQAESSRTKSQVLAVDLQRRIQLSVVDVFAQLQRARAAHANLAEAIGFGEKSLSSSEERFNAGDLSLTDVLLTEEELTQQRLSLVDAAATVAKLEARLRFEAGRLLEGGFVDRDFVPREARLAGLTPTP